MLILRDHEDARRIANPYLHALLTLRLQQLGTVDANNRICEGLICNLNAAARHGAQRKDTSEHGTIKSQERNPNYYA